MCFILCFALGQCYLIEGRTKATLGHANIQSIWLQLWTGVADTLTLHIVALEVGILLLLVDPSVAYRRLLMA